MGDVGWFTETSGASAELFISVVTVCSDWPGSPGIELVPFVSCQTASAKHTQLASSWLFVHIIKPSIMMAPTVGLQSLSLQYL